MFIDQFLWLVGILLSVSSFAFEASQDEPKLSTVLLQACAV